MSKQTFQEWLSEQDYYVTRREYENAQDRHDVSVTLPKGITILWDDDYGVDVAEGNDNDMCASNGGSTHGDEGTDKIPTRDIRHGDWSDK